MLGEKCWAVRDFDVACNYPHSIWDVRGNDSLSIFHSDWLSARSPPWQSHYGLSEFFVCSSVVHAILVNGHSFQSANEIITGKCYVLIAILMLLGFFFVLGRFGSEQELHNMLVVSTQYQPQTQEFVCICRLHSEGETFSQNWAIGVLLSASCCLLWLSLVCTGALRLTICLSILRSVEFGVLPFLCFDYIIFLLFLCHRCDHASFLHSFWMCVCSYLWFVWDASLYRCLWSTLGIVLGQSWGHSV